MGQHPKIDFQDLVQSYYQPLFRFAYSLAKNESDAGDLVQQTFLIWAQKGDSLRDANKVKSWLFTTIYREFIRSHKKQAAAPSVEPEHLENEPDEANPDHARALEAKEAVEALQHVDEVYREPLLLFYMEDLAYKDIADILGLPIGTVMSRLSRGKSQLKDILSEKIRK